MLSCVWCMWLSQLANNMVPSLSVCRALEKDIVSLYFSLLCCRGFLFLSKLWRREGREQETFKGFDVEVVRVPGICRLPSCYHVSIGVSYHSIFGVFTRAFLCVRVCVCVYVFSRTKWMTDSHKFRCLQFNYFSLVSDCFFLWFDCLVNHGYYLFMLWCEARCGWGKKDLLVRQTIRFSTAIDTAIDIDREFPVYSLQDESEVGYGCACIGDLYVDWFYDCVWPLPASCPSVFIVYVWSVSSIIFVWSWSCRWIRCFHEIRDVFLWRMRLRLPTCSRLCLWYTTAAIFVCYLSPCDTHLFSCGSIPPAWSFCSNMLCSSPSRI